MNNDSALDARIEKRLKRAQLLSEADLQLVRELQKESPLSIAEAIVELDLLSAAEVDAILDAIHQERSINLADVQVDIEAVRHVPRQVAWKCKCVPIRRSGNTLVVAAASSDAQKVRDTLRGVTDFEIVLLVAESDAIEHALFVHYGEERQLENTAVGQKSVPGSGKAAWELRAPWKTSFDTFIDHEGASHAKELAKHAAFRGRDLISSPLMLIGPSGSGKTHLLDAIKGYCAAKEPSAKGILCSGDRLKAIIAEFAVCGTLDALRFDLRDCSVLLIDNFESLWGDELCEHEVADTLLALRSAEATVVIAISDESIVTGPSTQKLRDVLRGGTEAKTALPNSSAMQVIIETRCAANKNMQLSHFVNSVEDCADSWNTFRETVLRERFSAVRSQTVSRESVG